MKLLGAIAVTALSLTFGANAFAQTSTSGLTRAEVMAQLQQAQAQKAKDQAQLANARLDLKRYTTLLAQDAATQQQFDTQKALVAQLDASVKVDDAQINSAQVQLSYTKIVAPISGRVGARLVRLASDEQQEVVKGQILARLESEDLAGNIAQLQAQADYARKDYERYARLMAQNATARQTYERTLATLRAADAALRQARAQAAFMTLIAPAACRVISRDGEVGQYITANTPIFWLACDPHLRVTAQVDEEDIRLVRAGQRAVVRADGMPGRIFEGNVSEVTPMGDPVARSYRVRIAMAVDTPLLIGMTVQTNIVLAEHDKALLVPSAAIADGKVWVVRDGKLAAQAVTAGIKGTDQTEIVDGLNTTDVVAAKADAAFRDGMRVRPSLTQ